MQLLDLFFPKRCIGCGKIGRYFCERCKLRIRVIGEREAICPVCEKPAIGGAIHPRCKSRYSIDGLTSFFRYDGPVRKAIKTVKYRLVSDLVFEFIDLIPQFAIRQLDNSQLLVPIPLHSSRLRERGFNQAAILGKLIADKINIPLRTDILKRVRKTTPQVEMKKRDDRLKNMGNVFVVNNIAIQQYNNSAIFLFDDVFTTGATMRAAANILKRSGVKFVWGVTIAR
ncbi:ComF family protein [Patescibacteria group bacterium]|nr:ComF family protein [Patescibacteria group bacterium]MBU1472211.1 ComF family protein [Patescibacteria group bacterium]MBU2544525.1 ComF family protein [Patescibacteria group bacterium]